MSALKMAWEQIKSQANGSLKIISCKPNGYTGAWIVVELNGKKIEGNQYMLSWLDTDYSKIKFGDTYLTASQADEIIAAINSVVAVKIKRNRPHSLHSANPFKFSNPENQSKWETAMSALETEEEFLPSDLLLR